MMLGSEVMLDLETMGTGPNAAIIAIGATLFDFSDYKIRDTYYVTVDLQSCISAGMTMDASTVMWWMKQSDEARAEFAKKGFVPIVSALKGFYTWIFTNGGSKRVNVWGNGANFDNVILANAYAKCGVERPWSYRGDRCFRTLKELYPKIDLPRTGVGHKAIDDAIWQTEYLFALHSQYVAKG